ncbi:small integral membrane protein 32 [Heliangelus exortis]|uniref:small integral membrane protein 32 n=1 Tax=Heliangelus exortis TaxID=472823 RepID=UPI003A919C89
MIQDIPAKEGGKKKGKEGNEGQDTRQNAAGFQPFASRNFISFLCQRLTAFALLLYFYRGGKLSKNMYSELLNSTSATEAHIIQTNTPYLSGTPRPVSSSTFYLSTARVLKEGEINKPDLVTYIILFFFLLLTVTLIVLFINCQLKNSFFATLPYDRSLREARSPWRTQAV